MSISTRRHQDLFDPYKNNVPIHIIGAGATGSRVWLALVELGLTNITIYDDDIVEAHNIANQIYLNRDIKQHKVAALMEYYRLKTGATPPESMRFLPEKVHSESGHTIKGIVFLLTDTMASRKDIWHSYIKPTNSGVFLMIETRMGATHGNIYTVNPFDSEQCTAWEHSLVDDNDDAVETSACGTALTVGTTASVIANMAIWQMMHYLTNPEAMERKIDVYLKPLIVVTGS